MRYIGSNIGFLGKLYRYRYGKKEAYRLPILLPIRLSVHLYGQIKGYNSFITTILCQGDIATVHRIVVG